MKVARMHEYGKALILEDVPVPAIQPDEILVQVKACGMCRSDVQLNEEIDLLRTGEIVGRAVMKF